MDGVLNINKPVGISSFDVVRKIRKLTGIKKVGHTGTLDPEASGVLPVCIGSATKLVNHIMSDCKVYRVELMLGVVTDSYDREGTIVRNSRVDLRNDEIKKAIKSFEGEINQVPPMYSALKVNGRRLYSLARQGIEIEREPRKVKIYSINILELNLPKVIFTVKCSKGTYIRSLCYDIGEKLKCGGSMWNLQRIETGNFNIRNSVELDELTKDNIYKYIISMDKVLFDYPEIHIDEKYEKLLLNGVEMNNPFIIRNIQKNEFHRVYIGKDKFIGIGIRKDSGFKMTKLLLQR
ncbi:tRNA pseudouridine(55) synthase TruB [Clostridium fermenticellae]|uniref:tRNA pseudouridine synthase B n=1 Tax=Clostridium fermenticellae TaxID=2068654 RepID=A0A386H340_9CLOT|nr:tRNA pseudouridine(55) synthase TruB [Clostridium fermenticellae]AYD40074.1 tRNA pseudouridine(55) synthase TruB [Clostridium fermenticellae]